MARRKAKTSAGLQNPKTKINITITPESKLTLETITSETGLSRSAFIEGILNGSISLSSQTAQQVINLGASSQDKGLEVNISDEIQQEQATSSASANEEEIKVQKEKISALEKEIKEKEKEISQSNEKNKSLHQKLDDQLATVANLKKQLDQAKSQAKTSGDNQELSNLINKKEQSIQKLNQEISRLKAEIVKSKQADVGKSRTSSNLEYVTQRQKDTIARLEARIAELQTVASIGSHALNKWRSKVYQ